MSSPNVVVITSSQNCFIGSINEFDFLMCGGILILLSSCTGTRFLFIASISSFTVFFFKTLLETRLLFIASISKASDLFILVSSIKEALIIFPSSTISFGAVLNISASSFLRFTNPGIILSFTLRNSDASFK